MKQKYDATADTDQLIVDQVAAIAEKHGVARVQIALAWLLQKEPVTATGTPSTIPADTPSMTLETAFGVSSLLTEVAATVKAKEQ